MARSKMKKFNLQDMTYSEATNAGLGQHWLDFQERKLKKKFNVDKLEKIVDKLIGG